MSVTDVFDAVAGTYDEARRRLIPCFDAFYGTAVQVAAPPLRAALAAGRTPEVLDLGAGTGPRPSSRLLPPPVQVAAPPLRRRARRRSYPGVLDLGAGTGLLSLLLAAAVPGVRLTLVDGAPAMLARATDQLDARSVPHRTVRADLADELPAGPVRRGGQRAGDPPPGRRRQARALPAGRRRAGARRGVRQRRAGRRPDPGAGPALRRGVAGSGSPSWARPPTRSPASQERMRHDRPATVADQCRWLAEAGLVDVDCYFKEWRFAVFGGRAR